MRITPSPTTRTTVLALALVGPLLAATGAGSATPAGAAAAPACGATITGYAVLRADLTCHRHGLTLAPGATLDLGQHTLRIRERTAAAVRVSMRDGATGRAEIRNGTVRGGVGVVVTGTDDAADAGRIQRARLFQVTLSDSALRVRDAGVGVIGSTVIDSGVHVRAGSLDVVGSTLTEVRASSEAAPSGRPNAWRVADSSITGAWWTSGDTRVEDSTIIDTSAPRSTPADYRNVTVTGSRLTGPAFRVAASGTGLTLGRSVVDSAGGFSAVRSVRVSRTKIRDSGWVAADGASGRAEVDHSTFVGGKGVKAARVTVSDSTFTSIAQPLSGRNLVITDTRFARNRGDTVNAFGTLRALDNVFRDNKSTAIRTRGGLLARNDVQRQRGDGIMILGSPDATPSRLRANRVLDGKNWGILVTPGADPDLVDDLGGNVAAGNRLGQCSAPIDCSDG